MTRAVDRIKRAIDERDIPLLAAATRAGHPLPAAAAPVLKGLVGDGLAIHVAHADSRLTVALDDDAAPGFDGDHPPPTVDTPRIRKALVALLAATQDGIRARPYPGRPAPLQQVIALCRPDSAQAARHVLGGLRSLALAGYAFFNDEDESVRPGPELAAWQGRFVDEDLPELLARITEGENDRGPSR